MHSAHLTSLVRGWLLECIQAWRDAASEVYRILVDHLRDGHPEEFIEGLREFMSTMQIADSNHVVDLILVSIDRDLDQCEIRCR